MQNKPTLNLNALFGSVCEQPLCVASKYSLVYGLSVSCISLKGVVWWRNPDLLEELSHIAEKNRNGLFTLLTFQ